MPAWNARPARNPAPHGVGCGTPALTRGGADPDRAGVHRILRLAEIQVHRFALTAFSLYQQAGIYGARSLVAVVMTAAPPSLTAAGTSPRFRCSLTRRSFSWCRCCLVPGLAACGGGEVCAGHRDLRRPDDRVLWMRELVARQSDRDVAESRLSRQTGMWVLAFGVVLLIAESLVHHGGELRSPRGGVRASLRDVGGRAQG